MKIGFDIDGVLADFFSAYEDLTINIAERDLFGANRYPQVTPPTWNWPESYGYTHEEMKRVWGAITKSPDFWRDLEDMPDMRTFFRVWETLKDHEVYYITSRPGVKVQRQTVKWFEDRGCYGVSIIVSPLKGAFARDLGLDWYVDDKGENITDVEELSPHTDAFLLDRPYNQHVKVKQRVETLMQALQEGGVVEYNYN